MKQVYFSYGHPNGIGRAVEASLNADQMIDNDIGIQWESAPNEFTTIPWSNILKVVAKEV